MVDYSARFESPVLREAFNYVLYEKLPGASVLPFYFQLACHANQAAGVPEGGSLGLAHSVEARYRRLGGQLTCNACVDEILVEGDRAVGVRLSDGQEHFADVVVSAVDGHHTLMELLGGKHVDEAYRQRATHALDQPGTVVPGYFTLFLGLDRLIPEAEHCTTHLLTEDEAAELPGSLYPSINVQFRNRHYPELSPPGTSVVLATYFCDPARWWALNESEDRVSRVRRGIEVHTRAVNRGRRYTREKRRVAEIMIAYLERRYPGLQRSVVVRDASTPLTQLRYTGNDGGTVLPWQPLVDGGPGREPELARHGPVLPGLGNFYLSRAGATTGGVTWAAVAGRHVMQFICRDDGRPFTASVDDAAAPPTQVIIPAGWRRMAAPDRARLEPGGDRTPLPVPAPATR
jgi:phytoene dehydrogenase-like protein